MHACHVHVNITCSNSCWARKTSTQTSGSRRGYRIHSFKFKLERLLTSDILENRTGSAVCSSCAALTSPSIKAANNLPAIAPFCGTRGARTKQQSILYINFCRIHIRTPKPLHRHHDQSNMSRGRWGRVVIHHPPNTPHTHVLHSVTTRHQVSVRPPRECTHPSIRP
jgi:hypothetical protein